MIARAFRDTPPLVMFFKFSNCTRRAATIYHEMHSRLYDFLLV